MKFLRDTSKTSCYIVFTEIQQLLIQCECIQRDTNVNRYVTQCNQPAYNRLCKVSTYIIEANGYLLSPTIQYKVSTEPHITNTALHHTDLILRPPFYQHYRSQQYRSNGDLTLGSTHVPHLYQATV